ncbi:MAG: hypothetical protein KGL39_50835 [Patescibacteria group bacterium]|nr:hypothetical protein [Patescibacteria group bacterium]
MKRVRLVQKDEAPIGEMSMNDALDAIVSECKADAPETVMLTWEANGERKTRSLPDSLSYRRGTILDLSEEYFPGSPE